MGNQQSRRRIPNNSVAPMGNRRSRRQIPNDAIAPMDTQQSLRLTPNFPQPFDPKGDPQSHRQIPNNPIASMDTQQSRHRLLGIKLRVLIIGRANSGKTSILQRVCDTTGSPVIYRGKEKVRGPTFLFAGQTHCRLD